MTILSTCWSSWLGANAGLPGKFWLGGIGGSLAFIELIRCSPLCIRGFPALSRTALFALCSWMRASVSWRFIPSRWVSRCCSSSSNFSFTEMASSESLSISYSGKQRFFLTVIYMYPQRATSQWLCPTSFWRQVTELCLWRYLFHVSFNIICYIYQLQNWEEMFILVMKN